MPTRDDFERMYREYLAEERKAREVDVEARELDRTPPVHLPLMSPCMCTCLGASRHAQDEEREG